MHKGGTGKTTTTINLAHALAARELRVLAIDADPQANLTFYCGLDERDLEREHRSLYYALLGDKSLAEVIIEGNPAVAPSSLTLAKAEPELMAEPGSSWVLREKLEEVRDRYDVILIDCPPSLSMLTLNALSAADAVIIPVKTDLLSTLGVSLLIDTITKIRRRGNSKLKILGILPTLFNATYRHDKQVLEELHAIAGVRVFDPIQRSTGFDQAPGSGQPTLTLMPKNRGVEAYHKLAEEVAAYVH